MGQSREKIGWHSESGNFFAVVVNYIVSTSTPIPNKLVYKHTIIGFAAFHPLAPSRQEKIFPRDVTDRDSGLTSSMKSPFNLARIFLRSLFHFGGV